MEGFSSYAAYLNYQWDRLLDIRIDLPYATPHDVVVSNAYEAASDAILDALNEERRRERGATLVT